MRTKYFRGTYFLDEFSSFLDWNVCLKTAEHKDLTNAYIQRRDVNLFQKVDIYFSQNYS